jgi:heme exporter protein D
MDAFYEFLNMGGYAFYVWTSYAIAAVVLIANLIAPVRLRRKLLLDLNRKARRELRDDAKT